MNCLVVSDYNWDNMPVSMKRIAKIPKDTRVNILYGNNTEAFSKIVSSNELNLIRRDVNDFSSFASTIDYCIIFTNLIEYNNHSRYIIDFCEDNVLPYIIFTESDIDFLINMEPPVSKFSKVIKTFTKSTSIKVTKPFKSDLKFSNIKNIERATQNLRLRYARIRSSKHTIVIL
jgi:hypothetical protein